MKKSRIAKLALMGASITALAATLTTSTYAWYVSNKQASMTNGTGATGAAGSDGSILLSWTGNTGKWFKEISFADADATSHKTVNALQPVHYSATDKDAAAAPGFYGIAANGTQGSISTDYITFTLKIKSDAATTQDPVNVTPVMTITTTKQADNHGQVAYVGTGLPTAAGTVENTLPSAGSTFTVDAKKSLYVSQVVGSAAATYMEVDSTATGGNAHNYYTAVTSNTPWATTPVSASGLGQITLTSAAAVDLTYVIFLDGGDTDCFNSCAGWDIAFSLTYSVVEA